jgi:hypothetical protein
MDEQAVTIEAPEPPPEPPSRLVRHGMAAAWAGFLMAGVMEALVFAVVDPQDLSWFGTAPISLSREAIYTVSFLIFWGVITLGASLALLLAQLPVEEPVPERRAPGWPR